MPAHWAPPVDQWRSASSLTTIIDRVSRGPGGEAETCWHFGWPWRALSMSFASNHVHDYRDSGGFATSEYWDSTHLDEPARSWWMGAKLPRWLARSVGVTAHARVPVRPLWLGFTLNTLLLTMTFFLALNLPFVLRRHHRTRRGLCPRCAYQSQGAQTCPECGWVRRISSPTAPPR